MVDLVIATPDVGGSKRASTYAKYLDVPLVLCHKTREKANVVATMQIIGDVKDKNVVLVDDIVDTAGTITKAANIMLEAGAKSVRAIASHCVMSYFLHRQLTSGCIRTRMHPDVQYSFVI